MNRAVSLALLLALAVSAGCTVRPLYSDAPVGTDGTTTGAALASVLVRPVKTRDALEVRNQLIFLFNGGKAQTSSPAYELELGVVTNREVSTISQTSSVNQPTSGTVAVSSNYILLDAKTGQPVARGRRQITAQYDIPDQEFAAYRAQRDAENRAARELAELLRLTVAQDIVRHSGG